MPSKYPSNQREHQAIYNLLEKFKIPNDAVLLVHSAFKQFKLDGYNADKVLQALVDYLRPGTLLLPTMSWRFVNDKNPIFDELTTPCNTGILAEAFRTQHATCRSIHPTHSVAGCGSYAADILSQHYLSQTPCDNHSPFGKLAQLNSYIIMLGVGIDCCTMLHHVEEIVAPELYVTPASQAKIFSCFNRNRERYDIKLRKHYFLPRNYWQFQDMLATTNKLAVHNMDNAIAIGFLAADLIAAAKQTLHNNPRAIIAKPGQRFRMM